MSDVANLLRGRIAALEAEVFSLRDHAACAKETCERFSADVRKLVEVVARLAPEELAALGYDVP